MRLKKTSVSIFNELDFKIIVSEINKAISKLNNGEAAGPDRICNEMIKHGQTFLTPILLNIFNACLSQGYYPSVWCEGYITPVYKSNKTNDPNNNTGNTITSSNGKLFNSILNSRLGMYIQSKNIINPCQISFTKQPRTSDNVFVLIFQITKVLFD